MSQHTDYLQKKARRQFLPFFTLILTLFLLIQLGTLYFIYRQVTIDSVASEIKASSARVENGLKYENGKWDTRLYTSDPLTPHPSGSSGYTQTLYIITADGFVIERNSPISGLLDTSDFKHLIAFQKPQTISLVTSDRWRLLSKPIVRDNVTKGVVMAAYYNPGESDMEQIDAKLLQTVESIDRKITVSGRDVSINKIDIRTLDYDVSFEVVNSFNKVLLNNGRMPTYIDKSYVMNEIGRSGSTRIMNDAVTGKQFLVYSNAMTSSAAGPAGVIVTARSIDTIDSLFRPIALYLLGFDLLAGALAYVLIRKKFDRFLEYFARLYEESKKNKPLPKSISFHKKESTITIDGELFRLPYGSNQYYLCDTLFSAPHKRWGHEELLGALSNAGEVSHWRKVYDAMLAVNKKLGLQLIEGRDRTFCINPKMASAVQRSGK